MRAFSRAAAYCLTVLALILFADRRTEIGAWLDGLWHAGDAGRLIGRNQAVVDGVRLSLTKLQGAELAGLAVAGNPDIRSHGYGVRMSARGAGDALSLDYRLMRPAERGPGIAYTLRISGEVLGGEPKLGLTCAEAPSVAGQPGAPRLPDISAIDRKKGWSLTGSFEPVATDIEPAVRITGPEGRYVGYAPLGPIIPDHKISALFWARASAGAPEVTAFLGRGGGYDGASLVFKPAPEWQLYVLTHPGRWTGNSPMHAGFTQGGGNPASAAVEIAGLELRVIPLATPEARRHSPAAAAAAAADARTVQIEVANLRRQVLRMTRESGWNLTGDFKQVLGDKGSVTQISAKDGKFLGYVPIGAAVARPVQMTFEARAVKGSPSLSAIVGRGGGYDTQTLPLNPGPEWRQYTFTHTGKWSGESPVHVGFTNQADNPADAVVEIAGLEVVLLARTDAPATQPIRPQSGAARVTMSEQAFRISGYDSVGLTIGGPAGASYKLHKVDLDRAMAAPATRSTPKCEQIRW